MTIAEIIEQLQRHATRYGSDTEVYVCVPDDADDLQDGPATSVSYSIGRVFIESTED